MPTHASNSAESLETLASAERRFEVRSTWSFLVAQRVTSDDRAEGHTLHFHTETFAEALEIAEEVPPCWRTEGVFLVAPPRGLTPPHLHRVLCARCSANGYLCELDTGLLVLVDVAEFAARRTNELVYSSSTESSDWASAS